MVSKLLTLILSSSLLLLGSAALAQSLRVGPVYADRADEVSVVVELPPGVTSEAPAFRLVANGEVVATAKEVKPFRDSQRGLALVLCVDVSGTMAGRPLSDTKNALRWLALQVRPQDQVALVSFADKPEVEADFGSGPRHLEQAIDELRRRGKNTVLYQALSESLDMLNNDSLPQRRRVLVISDGKDEGSSNEPESVIEKSKAFEIPIDALGRGKIERQYVEALRGLAIGSGGHFKHARVDRLDLPDAVKWIYGRLLERTQIVYFRYKTATGTRSLENAFLELRRSDGTWTSHRMFGHIPPPEKSVAQAGPWLIRIGLLLALLLALGLALFFTRRSPRPEVPPKAAQAAGPSPASPARKVTEGGEIFPRPGPGQPAAVLVGINGPLKGKEFAVEKVVYRIGAGVENDLRIERDEYVSRAHASLRYEHDGGRFVISDERSRNGTFVNGQRLTRTPSPIRPGDRIQVGASTLKVVGQHRSKGEDRRNRVQGRDISHERRRTRVN